MLNKNVSRKGFIKKSMALVASGLAVDAYFFGLNRLKAADIEEVKEVTQPESTVTPLSTASVKKYPVPGEIIVKKGEVDYNLGRSVTTLKVTNTGDRPIQVGSHFHFFEVNRKLKFDRSAAFGKHLNLIASTAVRFEPGEEKDVELVPFAGKRIFIGANNLVDSQLSEANKAKALAKGRKLGFLGC